MRRIGKTTRTLDRCIQELFNNGFTYLWEGPGRVGFDVDLMEKFNDRMRLEHPSVKYTWTTESKDGIDCYYVKLVVSHSKHHNWY